MPYNKKNICGPRVAVLLTTLLSLAACSRSRSPEDTRTGDGGAAARATAPSPVAGGPATAGIGSARGPSIRDAPEGTVAVEGTPRCAGKVCAANEQCCLLTGRCIETAVFGAQCALPDSVSEVPPPGIPPLSMGTPALELCAANSDCAGDAYCENGSLCLGVGYCASRTNCPASSPLAVCGCDGLTYPNVQSACFAGTRLAGRSDCGQSFVEGGGGSFAGHTVTTCADASDCGQSETCCVLTGRCYPLGRDAVCAEPPPGSDRACLDDSDCLYDDFCQGAGCDGPGGCVARSSVECTGRLEPVCGCDGNSYTSAACATAAGVRTAHSGSCGDTDA
jgi:hypothetical protein